MEIPPLPAGRSGIGMLESFVGRGFAAALQDGLSRSVPPYAPEPRAGTGRRSAPLERRGPGREHEDEEELSPGELLSREAGAILALFERRLRSAPEWGPELGPDTVAVRAALTAFAGRVLDDAGGRAEEAAGRGAPRGPGSPVLTLHLAGAAGSLLTECALLHVAEGPHCARALARALALIRPIGRAVRRQTAALPVPAGAHGDLWHERRRLAREVHDGLGTDLFVALRRLELRAAHDDDPGGHLAAAGTSLRSALGTARGLATGLREQSVVPPLQEAVESFTAQAAPGPVRVVFSATGAERTVPDSSRHELFLAVRECLRNCFQHAGADQITVTSRVTRRWTHVRVKDNGTGFDAGGTGPAVHDGNGLRCVAERIAAIGGRVTIDSAPGEGTSIDIHLPLHGRPRTGRAAPASGHGERPRTGQARR